MLKCPCVQRWWNWTFDCGFPFWWSDILIRGAFSSPERLSKPCRSVASGSQTREGAQVRKSRRISCPQRSNWHGFPWQWLHLLHGWWRCGFQKLVCALLIFAPRTDRNEEEMRWLRVDCMVLFYFCCLYQIMPDEETGRCLQNLYRVIWGGGHGLSHPSQVGQCSILSHQQGSYFLGTNAESCVKSKGHTQECLSSLNWHHNLGTS